MPRLRPRFTIGRIMIVVVVAAVGLAGFRFHQIRQRRLHIASQHEVDAALTSAAEVETMMRLMSLGIDPTQLERDDLRAMARRRSLYHREMARKYQHAAERPWLSVPPDPPEPK